MKIIGILSGLISAYLLYKAIFSDKEEFIECIKFWLTPNVVSLFRGEYWDDYWAEFKLIVWLGLSVAIGFGVSSL